MSKSPLVHPVSPAGFCLLPVLNTSWDQPIDQVLSPPSSREEDWSVDGMLNAHTVASTTICFELTNVTNPSMAFRVEADPDAFEFYDWENQPHAIADIFGMEPMDELLEGDAVQELGSVKLPLDRMLTYPPRHGEEARSARVDRP